MEIIIPAAPSRDPQACARKYKMPTPHGNRPETTHASVTQGFVCPPEILLKLKIIAGLSEADRNRCKYHTGEHETLGERCQERLCR